MLDDTNIYKKSYKTYSITNTEQKYKLVIFPSDNTFSIFNNKQCSNSEHDGLIIVQSGSKKYLTMVFKVGTMAELHEAQKLLGKAMNIIYILLEEPNVEQPVEEKTFETIIMYKNPNDGNDVDLLSITGVKQKMNLYVTSLIDIVFTHEELLELDATKIKFNDGYKLIQEAVRSKFRLSDDIFKIEWYNLHETFLNKRRDIKKGLRKQETTVQTNPSAQI
ncbi:unnamed protein product [Rotaria sordida]|uniref:Uncharacterized protein n=5 Tax=Rotaria sordida TaxID=392033 RepID=A0A815YY93_9BILA|nr:unnamed protein product [Rotaria sordida]CAF1576413.1 unnamed protein product [Rotaria sordida]